MILSRSASRSPLLLLLPLGFAREVREKRQQLNWLRAHAFASIQVRVRDSASPDPEASPIRSGQNAADYRQDAESGAARLWSCLPA